MRCLVKILCLLLMVLVSLSTLGMAAGTTPSGQQGAAGPQTAQVTEFELAVLLVQQLGLVPYLPRNPSPNDYFSLLMMNGITLADKWQADKPVTRYDLARAVVLATKQGSKIDNPDNPQSWIDYLVSTGVRVDTIGLATQ